MYYEYTDRVEPFGTDECWLDISGSLSYFGSWENIVSSLLKRVKEEIGLTLSIGVSFNKIYAKLGSDLAPEDSYCRIDSLDDIRRLPASKLLFVGDHAGTVLESHGILTIGDLAAYPRDYLRQILGKQGDTLYEYANGIGHDEVSVFGAQDSPSKSVSCCHTAVRDLRNEDDVRIVLTMLCDSVAARLCQQGLYFRTIHLFVRDRKLKVRTMQVTLKENSDLAKDICSNALSLFRKHCDFSIPYRSIGVAVSSLSFGKDPFQTSLFGESGYSLKQKKEEDALRTIRRRFGEKAVFSLRALEDSGLSGIGSGVNGR